VLIGVSACGANERAVDTRSTRHPHAGDSDSPASDATDADEVGDSHAQGDVALPESDTADAIASDGAAMSDLDIASEHDDEPGDPALGDSGAGDSAPGDIELWQPPLCVATPNDCVTVSHQLPIPTHFSASIEGFEFMAHDAPSLTTNAGLPGDYTVGACYPYYNYGVLPDIDLYLADRYSSIAVSDTSARTFAQERCAATGVPLEHRFPPTVTGIWPAGAPASGSCRTQVIHATVLDTSVYTVFLPPNWSGAAPANTYPIVFDGAYDLNGNTFSSLGASMADWVSESGLNGRRGVIGVLWNGGGGSASLTMNEHALEMFAAMIAEVSERYHGNPDWIVTFGGSRGGVTALEMAANPNDAPYRVVLAVAGVPPTLIGDIARSSSTTYPLLLGYTTWTTGFLDAWRSNWHYPSCAGRPNYTGILGWQAFLQVVTGTIDPNIANTQHSLLGERFLAGLQRAQSQVYLQIGEHDFVVPYAQQARYAMELLGRGVDAQVEVVLRGGHNGLLTNFGLPEPAYDVLLHLVKEAVLQLANPDLDLAAPPPSFVTPGLRFHRVMRDDGRIELVTPNDGQYPFAVDLPWIAARGTRFPIVAVGEPGTQYELTLTYSPTNTLAGVANGTLGTTFTHEQWIDVGADTSLGSYLWALRILRPGRDWETISSTATPTGAPCTTEVVASEPLVDGVAANAWGAPPTLPARGGTNWGLSQY